MIFGSSTYVVIMDGKVIEYIKASSAKEAFEKKTKNGLLFIMCGGQNEEYA